MYVAFSERNTYNIHMNTKPIIQIRNLNKTFKSANGDFTALKDVSLDINEGEIFGIIGLSGAGKSTLVRCINYLEQPTSGSILFDGKDMAKLSKNELLAVRRRMSMIFQQFNLLMQRTALENICFPLEIADVPKAEALKRASLLLETVGLADKADSYPAQLSGGQKQRIAIAGILAMQPQCIVLDEPTAMLDPNGRDEVMTTLLKLNREKNMTVVLITHYMEEAVLADRVVVMDAGKILTQGTPEDVFSQAELLKKHRLDVPQATELAYRLRGCGVKFDKLPLNAEQCVKMLEEVLS